MNEGDDSDKHKDKFCEIDKLHNLFRLFKDAYQESEEESDPVTSMNLKKVTTFSIIDLLIQAQMYAGNPTTVLKAEERLQTLRDCFMRTVE